MVGLGMESWMRCESVGKRGFYHWGSGEWLVWFEGGGAVVYEMMIVVVLR